MVTDRLTVRFNRGLQHDFSPFREASKKAAAVIPAHSG
jgi:hypothetical protein